MTSRDITKNWKSKWWGKQLFRVKVTKSPSKPRFLKELILKKIQTPRILGTWETKGRRGNWSPILQIFIAHPICIRNIPRSMVQDEWEMVPAPGSLLVLGRDRYIKDDITTCRKCQKYEEVTMRTQRLDPYPESGNWGRFQEGGNHWTKVWKMIWS